MNRRKLREKMYATARYSGYIAMAIAVAMFSFFPLGAYLPKKLRNPAAGNGLPTLVVKEKEQKVIETTERVGLDS